MARVLAFDTSGASTSVAVCDGARVLAEQDTLEEGARHAERLLPSVEHCLAQAGLVLADIDVLGVGIGPGSFTGVRVGVATAKGLGLSLGKPVCGVVSLAALAVAAAAADTQDMLLAPLLDAFKGELFAALARVTNHGLAWELEPFHASPAAAWARLQAAAQGRPWTVLGAGYRRYASELVALPAAVSVLPPAFDTPRAQYVARLALDAHARGDVPELAQLAPLYVRDSDAQLPKVPLRL